MLIVDSMTRSPSKAAMNDEWHSLSLDEKQAWLTRRVLHVMRELLSSLRPLSDDQERDLQLRVWQSAIANARRAKTVLARSGGLTPLAGVLQEIAAFGTVH
jgi:hypothetical protein